MKKLPVLLQGMFLALTAFSCLKAGRTRQEILSNLLMNSSGVFYDNRVPPNFEDDFPTPVNVQIYVLSFDSVTEASMVNSPVYSSYLPPTASPSQVLCSKPSNRHANSQTRARGSQCMAPQGQRNGGHEFSISIFLRLNWSDTRLAWSDDIITEHLEVDSKFMDLVWVPDMYFVNEKEAILHDVTVQNKLLHIHKNGTIQSSTRISMTLSCDMFLERYPHDEQTCSLVIGSWKSGLTQRCRLSDSYSKENVLFLWHQQSIIMRPKLTLPRFQVQFDRTKECNFLLGKGSMIIGNYTCIQADFHLRRQFGYYIVQVYVPGVLIVVLSWVSFWIDIDAIPARVSLGLLTVLAMTTQSTGEKANLPKVSYVKAIDIWMAACLMFVFTALLEFAYVNVQSRVEKRRLGSVMDSQKKYEASDCRSSIEIIESDVLSRPCNRRFVLHRDRGNVQRARFVDKCSRVVFPVLFTVFNCSYWIYYWQG